MAGQEGIVYTPDMYEYFFVDDDENTKTKVKDKDCTPEKPSTELELASASSVDACWPEACEFFFDDGPQVSNREGMLFSMPSSQDHRASRIFQSIVPDGLKGFTMKAGFCGKDGKFITHQSHGIAEDTNVATTALLANIGAASAIRYLRRRRRTRKESSLEPIEET